MPASFPRAASARGLLLPLLLATVLTACSDGQPPTPGAQPGGRGAGQITGAGASFVFPVMARWSSDYARDTGVRVNYQSIGSGGGIAQIRAGTVDFGSSDAPLSSEALGEAALIQFPSVIGGVVPVANVPGVEPGRLRLSGEVLADIFLGKIVQWNDPAVAALNPDLTLPATRVTVVHRSDGSGTTFNFANYLSKVSAEWRETVGEGTSVRWPTGIGGRGNEGVAAYVQQVDGGIGYVELSYALQDNMGYTLLQNRAGRFVEPNGDSFQAAAASADWTGAQDFDLVMTDAPGEDAWPIAATNFILLRTQGQAAARNRTTIEFFSWIYDNGDEQAVELHYVPLPDELVEQVRAYWDEHLGG